MLEFFINIFLLIIKSTIWIVGILLFLAFVAFLFDNPKEESKEDFRKRLKKTEEEGFFKELGKEKINL